jgi:hypothetical protein
VESNARLTFVLVLKVQVPRVVQAAPDNPHGRNGEAAKRPREISKPEKEPGQVKVTIGELRTFGSGGWTEMQSTRIASSCHPTQEMSEWPVMVKVRAGRCE